MSTAAPGFRFEPGVVTAKLLRSVALSESSGSLNVSNTWSTVGVDRVLLVLRATGTVTTRTSATVGPCMSGSTVMGNVNSAEFPSWSVAVQATTVEPTGNLDAGGGVHEIMGIGSPTSTAIGRAKETVAPSGPIDSTAGSFGTLVNTGGVISCMCSAGMPVTCTPN